MTGETEEVPMPITFVVDQERRRVVATATGDLGAEDFFVYQRDAWGGAGVGGYDEIVDMTGASRIREATPERVRELAQLAASMDVPRAASRLAIVAPADLAYGLGRMYEAFRGLARSPATKTVAVFRTRAEAEAWLAGPSPA